MEFFKYLTEKCKEPVENVLWNCCEGDYRLIYKVFPDAPDKNEFVFYGPKKNYFIPCELFSVKTPDEVIESMKTLYPKMSEEDWDTFDKLYIASKKAGRIVFLSNNETTRMMEERALQELLEFHKAHGLEY